MGNPRKGTAAYRRKLMANKERRQQQRQATFAKTPAVKALVEEAVVTVAGKYLSLLSVCHQQAKEKTYTAESFRKLVESLMHENKRLEEKAKDAAAQGQRAEAKARRAEKALAAEKAAHLATKEMLSHSDLSWGWVLAKVSRKEAVRLRRLAAKPPRNFDGCWGGGQ